MLNLEFSAASIFPAEIPELPHTVPGVEVRIAEDPLQTNGAVIFALELAGSQALGWTSTGFNK